LPARWSTGTALATRARWPGDVQWMTAGSGILHQEMPRGDAHGACTVPVVGQPARSTEDDRPALSGHSVCRHTRVTEDDGTKARIICGEFWASRGRWRCGGGPRYVDISVPPGKKKRIQVETSARLRLCVRRIGNLPRCFGPQAVLTESPVDPNAAALYDAKNIRWFCSIAAMRLWCRRTEGIRFLLVSGKPLEERWRGMGRL